VAETLKGPLVKSTESLPQTLFRPNQGSLQDGDFASFRPTAPFIPPPFCSSFRGLTRFSTSTFEFERTHDCAILHEVMQVNTNESSQNCRLSDSV